MVTLAHIGAVLDRGRLLEVLFCAVEEECTFCLALQEQLRQASAGYPSLLIMLGSRSSHDRFKVGPNTVWMDA